MLDCEARNETRDLDLPDDLQQKFQKKCLEMGRKEGDAYAWEDQSVGGRWEGLVCATRRARVGKGAYENMGRLRSLMSEE